MLGPPLARRRVARRPPWRARLPAPAPHADGAESPFFRALATGVLRHRALAAALLVAVTVLAGWLAATRLRLEMSVLAFMDKSSEAAAVLDDYRARFGRDDVFVVLVEGDVFTAPFLERLRAVHREIGALDVEVEDFPVAAAEEAAPPPADDPFADFAELEGADEGWGDEAGGTVVDEITSLVNARRIRGRTEAGPGGREQVAIEVGELLAPWPSPDALPALKAEVLADPYLVGRVVDAAGRHAAIIVRTRLITEEGTGVVDGAIREVLARHEAPGFRPMLAGAPALAVALRHLMLREMTRLSGLVFLVVMAVLLWLFRHPLGLVVPAAVVILSAVWAFGYMAARGSPVTMLTNILPAFLVAVGVGDSVHLLSVYRQQRRRGLANDDAIVRTVALTGKPVLFTSLTTMFGLVSFNFATIDAIADLGNAGAFGVGAALVLSLVGVPLMLTLSAGARLGGHDQAPRSAVDGFIRLCSTLSGRPWDAPPGTPVSHRLRRGTLLVTALLTVLAGVGISKLRVWHDALSWLPADDPTRQAFEAVDEHLGGVATVQLVIEPTSPLGAKDLALLRGLEALQAHLRAFRHPSLPSVVGPILSVVEVLEETHRALHGGAAAELRLPDTQAEASDLMFLFENAAPEALRRLATADLGVTQMTVFVKWLEATSYGPLTRHVEAGVREHLAGLATVRATGTALTLFTTVSMLIENLLRSFGVALALITVFMLVLLGEVRLGLIAMVPNILPIVFILGIMGATGVPIDLSNLLIASVAIGLAVDDTIHFLHGFKAHYRAHGDVEAAISDALRHTGRALVGTSVILCAGFGAMVAADLESLRRFGWLTALTAALALVVDLVVGPALVRTLYPRRGRKPAPVGP